MNDTIYQAAALIVPMIFAIVFHEVAHGWVARALGDPTASQLGRLSLNPLRHVDPVGTILLPGALKLLGLPVFGWAKPVPVDFRRLNNPRRDMILVAAAGPGMNLLMALLGAVFLGVVLPSSGGTFLGVEGRIAELLSQTPMRGFAALSFYFFLSINIFLAIFNLLPVPPFDGGHIMEGLLPHPLAAKFAGFHKQALLIMILLLVVLPYLMPQWNIVSWLIGPPVQWLNSQYMQLVLAIAGH